MAVNDKILDATIDHSVDLQFYSNGVVKRMLALINRTNADLSAEIQKVLERLPQDSFTVQRLESLLASLRSLNSQVYAQVSTELNKELVELVAVEATFQKQLFERSIPVAVSMASVNAEQVYTAALSRPFQGKLLKEWIAGLETDKAVRIRDAIRMGYVENQTIPQIVQRVRGTRALNYTDGVIDITKRHAETIVRSAVSHMAAFTRERFFDANSEVLKAVMWSSALDGKTSDICKVRDGKQYTHDTHKPIGHSFEWLGGPGVAHLNCRSAAVGVTKSWRELGLDMDELPPSTRASMDGQVPEDMTYGQWLKGKDAEFQDEVLGKAKGKAFRAGLPLDRFTNNKGKSYTIEQLKERNSSYFD